MQSSSKSKGTGESRPFPVFLIQLLACVLWAVIGLLPWVRLVVVHVFTLTGAYLLSAFSGEPLNASNQSSSRVFSFYLDGFFTIMNKPDGRTETEPLVSGGSFVSALKEVFLTVVFWGAVLCLPIVISKTAAWSGSSPDSSLEDVLDLSSDGEGLPEVAQLGALQTGLQKQEDTSRSTRIRGPHPLNGSYCPAVFSECERGQLLSMKSLQLRAPSRFSKEITMQMEVCNALKITARLWLKNIYFVDGDGTAANWDSVGLPRLRPSECTSVELKSLQENPAFLLDFETGQINIRVGGNENAIVL